jgi:pre-mRNA-processing factor 8
MGHAQDIPLVKNWYLEHCPPNQVVKVWVEVVQVKRVGIVPGESHDQEEYIQAVEGD